VLKTLKVSLKNFVVEEVTPNNEGSLLGFAIITADYNGDAIFKLRHSESRAAHPDINVYFLSLKPSTEIWVEFRRHGEIIFRLNDDSSEILALWPSGVRHFLNTLDAVEQHLTKISDYTPRLWPWIISRL
jgi:hypothetical protein